MITFQEWKKDQNIDESFDVGLGISTPQSFASFGSFSDLLEARKKMKKKMDGDDSFGGKDKDDDMGDDSDDDHDDDDDDRDDDDDMGDDSDNHDDDDDDMGGDKKNRPDDDDNGDDNNPGVSDNNPGVSDNPMMRMKKKMAKMKKKMQAEAEAFRDEDVIEEKKTEKKTEEKCDCGKCEKCNPKCDCGKCEKCNPKKESFAQSLANMLNDQKPNTRFSSFGGYTDGQNSTFGEDAVLPMIDPNTGLIIPSVNDHTPVDTKAGEVGFAPQVRLGMF